MDIFLLQCNNNINNIMNEIVSQQRHYRNNNNKTRTIQMSDSDFGFDGGDSDLASDDEEVVDTSFVNEDVLVTTKIDDSSCDDEVVVIAEIITKNDTIVDT